WLVVGSVSLNSTTVPAAAAGSTVLCTQNVSPVGSNAWNTSTWPSAGIRATALSQSFPTPYTSDPVAVDVTATRGAPLGALAAANAPTPPDQGKVTTVKDIRVASTSTLALTVMLDRASGAVAFQISTGPAWTLAPVTRVHSRPPPDTVIWELPAV